MDQTLQLKRKIKEFKTLPARHPYLALFTLALAFRFFCAFFFPQPGYSDAYYYSNVASSLWQGKGFREDYLWNYLASPLPSSPINNPSSLYWMPLTSVLIYFSYLLTGGTGFLASQFPAIILSSFLPPLTFYLAKDIWGTNPGTGYGWVGGILMIFSGIFAPYFSLPDNFAPFALLTFLVLLLFSRAFRLSPSQGKKANLFMVGAGVGVGLSYLTRVDGILLLLIPLVMSILNRFYFHRRLALGVQSFFLMFLAFFITLLPWLGRNLLDTGQFFPGGGIKTLFLREYNDFYSFNRPLDLAYYLNLKDPAPDWGLLPIIYSKLGALFLNLLIIGRGTLFFMAPLFLFGFFFRDKLRETPEREVKHLEGSGWKALEGLQPGLLPFTLYLVLLYLVMSFFFTFPSTRGSVFHSSGGLLPYLYLVSLAGLDKFIGWVGTFSRPGAFKARQNFYRTVLIGASILVSVGFTLNLASSWNEDFDNISQAKTWLKANVPANALVMVPDAPAFYFVTGRSAIVISTDSLKQNLDIARRYGASYMVLQTKYLTGPLYDLFYKGGIQGFELVARLNETKIYRLSPGNPTP